MADTTDLIDSSYIFNSSICKSNCNYWQTATQNFSIRFVHNFVHKYFYTKHLVPTFRKSKIFLQCFSVSTLFKNLSYLTLIYLWSHVCTHFPNCYRLLSLTFFLVVAHSFLGLIFHHFHKQSCDRNINKPSTTTKTTTTIT